jgi:hypothetical protein
MSTTIVRHDMMSSSPLCGEFEISLRYFPWLRVVVSVLKHANWVGPSGVGNFATETQDIVDGIRRRINASLLRVYHHLVNH